MQQTKQHIIRLLKRNGGQTTAELSRLLGISTTAVRRHVKILESEEIVVHRVEQRGMGRPSYVYETTVNAPAVFTQSYTTFVNSILKELTESNGKIGIIELFDERQASRNQQYIKLTKGETLVDRVASLARLMESEGRITTWQQLNENRFLMREHNCPLYKLGRKFDHPCRCEISLLQVTLQAKVKRVNHILIGDVACVYEIEDVDNGNHKDHEGAPQRIAAQRQASSDLSVGERYGLQ